MWDLATHSDETDYKATHLDEKEPDFVQMGRQSQMSAVLPLLQ